MSREVKTHLLQGRNAHKHVSQHYLKFICFKERNICPFFCCIYTEMTQKLLVKTNRKVKIYRYSFLFVQCVQIKCKFKKNMDVKENKRSILVWLGDSGRILKWTSKQEVVLWGNKINKIQTLCMWRHILQKTTNSLL